MYTETCNIKIVFQLHNQPIDRGFGFGQQVRYILSVSHIANEKMIQPEISYGKVMHSIVYNT